MVGGRGGVNGFSLDSKWKRSGKNAERVVCPVRGEGGQVFIGFKLEKRPGQCWKGSMPGVQGRFDYGKDNAENAI